MAYLNRPGGIIFSHKHAHLIEDECGAPEYFTGGARMFGVDGALGKIDPEELEQVIARFPANPDHVHSGQAMAVSITQFLKGCSMATRLASIIKPSNRCRLACEVEANEVFVVMSRNIVEMLKEDRERNQIPVNGILKVFLIPPERIDVPVMPVKFDGRLLFPLCRKCAMDYPRGATLKEYSCKHDENERGWVSTCTSIELAEALNSGYRVTKYFRALHYEKWDEELFKGYVSEFYVNEDSCKFSLRNTLSKSFITDSPAELRRFAENKSIEVNTVDKLTPDTILITYDSKNEFIEEHQTSNIVISLWTTSMARIHLLRAMQKIVGAPGCSLLYGDTDSVLFSYPKEQRSPLTSGPHLGDLAPEYDDCEIK
uniref:Beta_elim_lyase domain-containing protein n=1 Tax=Meloidogyne hapla TaxID=6305 RepID=A0A1I8BUA6_MELHA